MKFKYRYLIIGFLMIGLITSCGKKEEKFEPLTQAQIDSIRQVIKNDPREPLYENEIGVIETNFGTIIIKFFPDVAPGHTSNFKHLANHGYYDGTWFHRIIKGFMIQGGDILSRDANPQNDGTGGPGYTIPAEFSELPHYRGRLSMARSPSGPNTAGSQFFIIQNPEVTKKMLGDVELQKGITYPDSVEQKYLEVGGYPSLDREYTVFGEVIQGMDVVDKIANIPTNDRGKPTEEVIMTEVRVTNRQNVDL